MTIDSYVDPTTKVIQASNWTYQQSRLAGENMHTWLGPQDVPHITGTSEVFVNKVRFEFQGSVHIGGLYESYGFMVAGILPYDIASSVSGTPVIWSDYDDLKGWPINMGKRFYYALAQTANNSNNGIRMILTYSPRKSLILNREQALFVMVYNHYGQPIDGHLSVSASFKRGE